MRTTAAVSLTGVFGLAMLSHRSREIRRKIDQALDDVKWCPVKGFPDPEPITDPNDLDPLGRPWRDPKPGRRLNAKDVAKMAGCCERSVSRAMRDRKEALVDMRTEPTKRRIRKGWRPKVADEYPTKEELAQMIADLMDENDSLRGKIRRIKSDILSDLPKDEAAYAMMNLLERENRQLRKRLDARPSSRPASARAARLQTSAAARGKRRSDPAPAE